MKFDEGYFLNKNFNRGSLPTFYDTAYAALIKKNVVKGSKILEIGFSFGHLLKLLEREYHTFGVEISNFALKNARINLKRTILRKANLELKFPFLKRNFDAIIGIDIFEHFKNPEKVLRDCFEHLSNRGILIIKVPNKKSITLKILKVLRKEKSWKCYHDPTHYSVFELEDWIILFKKIGFSVKVLPSPPTNILKNFAKNNPSVFFGFFNSKYLNETITIIGMKNETN